MKLWMISRNNKTNIWYDENIAHIIRAESEEKARALAAEDACDEGENMWLNKDETTCSEIDKTGDEEIILTSFRSG